MQDGLDVIPSPHRVFDCAGGDCEKGSVMARVSAVLENVEDMDGGTPAEFGVPCVAKHRPPMRGWTTPLHLKYDDELMLKAELFVYHNPIMVVVDPDADMFLYTWSGERLKQPVYHITGPPLKAHVMVALGWGSVPEPHWIVKNSWGDVWGDCGLGKIHPKDVSIYYALTARGRWADWIVLYGVMIGIIGSMFAIDTVVWGVRQHWLWGGLKPRSKGVDHSLA